MTDTDDEVYDVLAVRAQRAEAQGLRPFRIRLGSSVYEWPAELPAEVLPLAARLQGIKQDGSPDAVAAISELFRALAGAQAEQMLAKLSIQDMIGIVEKYVDRSAGSGLGEPQGSPQSSSTTPKPQKQTSRRRTGSTSATTTAGR